MNPIRDNSSILIIAASQSSHSYEVVRGDRGQAITIPAWNASAKVHALIKTSLEWENITKRRRNYKELGNLEGESPEKWETLQIAAASCVIRAVSFLPEDPNTNQVLYLEKCVENTPTYQWFIEPYENTKIGMPTSIPDLRSSKIHELDRKHPKDVEDLAQSVAEGVLPTIQKMGRAFSKDLSSKAVLITYQEPGSATAQSLLLSK